MRGDKEKANGNLGYGGEIGEKTIEQQLSNTYIVGNTISTCLKSNLANPVLAERLLKTISCWCHKGLISSTEKAIRILVNMSSVIFNFTSYN